MASLTPPIKDANPFFRSEDFCGFRSRCCTQNLALLTSLSLSKVTRMPRFCVQQAGSLALLEDPETVCTGICTGYRPPLSQLTNSSGSTGEAAPRFRPSIRWALPHHSTRSPILTYMGTAAR
jgi:hypothetical protein